MLEPSASFTEFWAKFTVAACAVAANKIHPSVKETVFMNECLTHPKVARDVMGWERIKALLL
jgi:hypothetical protein